MHLMGTNFYFATKNRNLVQNMNFLFVDSPIIGYEVHVAKTSCGWLPLFEQHTGINSVKDYEAILKRPDVIIYDENFQRYTWPEFEQRVLKHNGGVAGAIPLEPIQQDLGRFYDPDMPDHTPVSHLEYGHGKYAQDFFKDEEGYEFSKQEFS